MKIFVTGATGFLGSHSVAEMSQRGHEIWALARNPKKTEALGNLSIHWITGSLDDLPCIASQLPPVEAVVHIAGITKALSQEEFSHCNAKGTELLVQALGSLKEPPKIFLYVSTIAVHHVGQNGGNFHVATESCLPLSYYGRSKLAGEKALAGLPRETRRLILRPPVLYGPGDTELLPLFKAGDNRFAPLWGRGHNRFSLCFVSDVAQAIADLLEHSPEKETVFCLDDGVEHTWRGLVKILSATLGKKVSPLPIPPPLFYAGAALSQSWAKLRNQPVIFTLNKLKEMRQKNWVCGHERLSELTGWRPRVSAEEGFAKTHRYYLDSGIL